MAATTTSRTRIQSIDIFRGLIMVIMALDHVRDFFHHFKTTSGGDVALNPTNLATTTPALFFTRWITHLCAPNFVLLAGAAAYLMGLRRTRAELSVFLLKRGLWLIIVEIVVISLAWTFDPLYHLIILQVIFAIGAGMIILGLLVRLPMYCILLAGAVIVLGHNLFNYPSVTGVSAGGFVPDLFYFSGFHKEALGNNHFIMIVYSVLPWTGVMLLGYGFGKFFNDLTDMHKRKKALLLLGSGLVALFVVLRLINTYGDPLPWSPQPRGSVFTFLSFLNINKYPPSLEFLCITIGIGMILLAAVEGLTGRVANFFRTYGRVPFFYYVLHLYLIHLIGVVVFFVQGYGVNQIVTPNNPFLFKPPDFGFGLAGVYAIWLIVVLLLYPLCVRYDRYKSTHTYWWLSYI